MLSCLIVYGLPKRGKTYASLILAKNLNVKLIVFDWIINFVSEFVRKKFEQNHQTIDFEGYFLPFFETKEDFKGFMVDLDLLISKHEKFFKNFYKKLIVHKSSIVDYDSGFDEMVMNLARNSDALEPFAEDILKMVLKYLVKQLNFFIIEGYSFNEAKNFREKLEKLCDRVFYLGCFYKQKNITFTYKYNGIEFFNLSGVEKKLYEELNPNRSSYQSFFKEVNDNSQSYSKLEKLGIPEDLRGKAVLDLGCNEGFFSFECEKKGAKVIGIERDNYWYDLALKRKNEFSSFVNFLNEDWKCLPPLNYKFDLVLFLTSFHYLKNNQLEVLTNICNKIKRDGLLILEVGLLNKNEGSFLIEDYKRPAGDVCQYTNKFTIEKLLKEAGFTNILFFGNSVSVVGDDIPRYVIHVTKQDEKSKKTTSSSLKKPENLPSYITKQTSSKKEINLYDVENLFLTIYNRNSFFRAVFNLVYKILRRTVKK